MVSHVFEKVKGLNSYEYDRVMRISSYKMTYDTGFAPNPFGSALTLATCKPGMRRKRCEGDWIAGFTSKSLAGHEVGFERLIYLMCVSEKLLIRDYFHDTRFQEKIPDMNTQVPRTRAGDNIYRPLVPNAEYAEHFEQVRNVNHFAQNKDADVSGEFVLIGEEFYYFGRCALALPDYVRPVVPKGQSGYGQWTYSPRADRFVEYIRERYRPGCHGLPHKWPENSTLGCRRSC